MTNAPMAQRHFTSVALAVTLVALAGAGRADALCLDNLLRVPAAKNPSGPAKTLPAAHVTPAVYRMGAAPPVALMPVSAPQTTDDPIVGLWEFQINGDVPPDFGTQAWHADGTELMFSAGRNPAAGDICQGVWKRVGSRTYSLNHIAMGWDFGSFGVRVHIHAVVQVAPSGDTYSGTFTADVFAVTPENPFDESNMLGSGSGTMTGTRVKPDSAK